MLIKSFSLSELREKFYCIAINNFRYKFIISLLHKKKAALAVAFILLFSIFITLFNNILMASFTGLCLLIFFNDILKNLKTGMDNLLHFQLIEFINEMIIMLKAGKTVREIIKESSDKFDMPLAAVLKDASNEIDINMPISVIFENFVKKCNSREVKLFINALEINRRIGGDLAYILNAISGSIRTNLESKSNLQTLTLQSKMSGYIISIFPILVLILLSIFMKEEFKSFFNSSFGLMIILTGGSLELLGILAVGKIINYEQ